MREAPQPRRNSGLPVRSLRRLVVSVVAVSAFALVTERLSPKHLTLPVGRSARHRASGHIGQLARRGQPELPVVGFTLALPVGRLKTGTMGNQRFTLSVNGRRVKVTVTDTSASRTEGVILSTASDAEGGYKRTVRITYTSEGHEGQRIITVTNVSS